MFNQGQGAFMPDFIEFITRPFVFHSWIDAMIKIPLLIIVAYIIFARLTGKLRMPWDKGGKQGGSRSPIGGGQVYRL